MKNINLFIYCAGGFGKEVLDIAKRYNDKVKIWNNIDFVDDFSTGLIKNDSNVYKYCEIENSEIFFESNFIVANGEPIARLKIMQKLSFDNKKLISIIDPSAIISKYANLESGVIVAPLCSVQSDSNICKNACINTMSVVGHDVRIGENTVISSMVNLGGSCTIGDCTYIGMGATIKEGISIGSNVIVGMGSVVYTDVPDGMIVIGNPARIIRANISGKIFK